MPVASSSHQSLTSLRATECLYFPDDIQAARSTYNTHLQYNSTLLPVYYILCISLLPTIKLFIHLIIITELLMEGNAKATFTSNLMENGHKN